jgi:AcrR family transcriptional regulator
MSTKDAILDAATTLFAERGFRDTSVREICALAEANIAAVNYHFGNKAALYTEVIRCAYESAGHHAPMPTLQSHSQPSEVLAAWVNWYMERLFGENSELTARLLLREAAAPTSTLDEIVGRQMFPIYEELQRIVCAHLSKDADLATIKRHCLSILGQCLVHRTSKAMIDRMPVEPQDLTNDIPKLAQHITQCALAALATTPAPSHREMTS